MNFKRYHVSKNLFDEIYPNIVSDTPKYKSIYVGDGDFTLSTNCPRYTTAAAMLFLLAGNVSGGASTAVNGVSVGISKTVTAVNGYVTIAYRYYPGLDPRDYQTMLNLGSTPQPYEPYSSEVWHDIPHYIHNTSTDTITTLPADIYANDTTATVGLKGNMEQASGVSPTTPIQPSECGERTGNLFDTFTTIGMVPSISTGDLVNYPSGASSDFIPIGEPNITLSQTKDNTIYIMLYDENKAYIGYTGSRSSELHSNIISGYSSARFAKVRIDEYSQSHDNNLMLNTGGIALPYEPYGYKIPILNNSQTTNVYLGEAQSTRRIKKLVLDGTESWQESGTVSGRIVGELRIPKPYGSQVITPAECIMCSHIVPMYPYPSDVLNRVAMNQYMDGTIFISFTDEIIGGHSFANFVTYLQQQYANGTPVCVWYVLATPTTDIVNEPIRKIGTYADEVSGITIPTIAGTNTLSIGTTLQPSEVTATYKGWHPVQSVHEAENGQWD